MSVNQTKAILEIPKMSVQSFNIASWEKNAEDNYRIGILKTEDKSPTHRFEGDNSSLVSMLPESKTAYQEIIKWKKENTN